MKIIPEKCKLILFAILYVFMLLFMIFVMMDGKSANRNILIPEI